MPISFSILGLLRLYLLRNTNHIRALSLPYFNKTIINFKKVRGWGTNACFDQDSVKQSSLLRSSRVPMWIYSGLSLCFHSLSVKYGVLFPFWVLPTCILNSVVHEHLTKRTYLHTAPCTMGPPGNDSSMTQYYIYWFGSSFAQSWRATIYAAMIHNFFQAWKTNQL